ncbi:hypothetical protein PoB_002160500 [Plakobranchus ocellatus]|uniref:Uncharacterized protein n=1 Tax=Plakobranchus ocellatus TaxID=259542 RepID=A0AAV3ZIZ7_9GAST|nr:hypothetical protein PoB_002160500 [Plakobranchus ocellatus]
MMKMAIVMMNCVKDNDAYDNDDGDGYDNDEDSFHNDNTANDHRNVGNMIRKATNITSMAAIKAQTNHILLYYSILIPPQRGQTNE